MLGVHFSSSGRLDLPNASTSYFLHHPWKLGSKTDHFKWLSQCMHSKIDISTCVQSKHSPRRASSWRFQPTSNVTTCRKRHNNGKYFSLYFRRCCNTSTASLSLGALTEPRTWRVVCFCHAAGLNLLTNALKKEEKNKYGGGEKEVENMQTHLMRTSWCLIYFCLCCRLLSWSIFLVSVCLSGHS